MTNKVIIPLTGIELISPLIKAGVLPDMAITKVTLTASPDELVNMTLEINLLASDAKIITDSIIAAKVAERIDV